MKVRLLQILIAVVSFALIYNMPAKHYTTTTILLVGTVPGLQASRIQIEGKMASKVEYTTPERRFAHVMIDGQDLSMELRSWHSGLHAGSVVRAYYTIDSNGVYRLRDLR